MIAVTIDERRFEGQTHDDLASQIATFLDNHPELAKKEVLLAYEEPSRRFPGCVEMVLARCVFGSDNSPAAIKHIIPLLHRRG